MASEYCIVVILCNPFKSGSSGLSTIIKFPFTEFNCDKPKRLVTAEISEDISTLPSISTQSGYKMGKLSILSWLLKYIPHSRHFWLTRSSWRKMKKNKFAKRILKKYTFIPI